MQAINSFMAILRWPNLDKVLFTKICYHPKLIPELKICHIQAMVKAGTQPPLSEVVSVFGLPSPSLPRFKK